MNNFIMNTILKFLMLINYFLNHLINPGYKVSIQLFFFQSNGKQNHLKCTKHTFNIGWDYSDRAINKKDSYQKNHDISLGFNPRNILDCRAKIGLPSISFKNKYTISTFIAIEPESPNFELFIKNFFEKKIEKGVTHAKLIIIELYEQSMHLINKTDISILSVNELKIHLHRENVRATQINK